MHEPSTLGPQMTETDHATHTRVPLSKERILRAAIDLADERGLDDLSMRKLATHLGFGVMSLYNHVASKEKMLEGMLDLIVGDIDHPEVAADWKASMRRSSISAHQTLLRHRWATEIWWNTPPGPARLAYMEALLRGLREGGLSADLTYHAYHALTMHIVGFTLQELNFDDVDDEELAALGRQYLGDDAASTYPYLTEHFLAHFDDQDHGNEFEFVLDLILDSLERLNG